jgi:tetratricopeptide (TPR) repeat protein
MNATRVLPVVVAACLASSSRLPAQPEPTAVGGDSGLEQALAAHFQSSVEHYAAGNFGQSLKSSEEALALLEQQLAVAYNNICSAQMRLGALKQAAEACNRAVQLVPGYERAWSNLAWVYAQEAEQRPTSGAYLNLSVAHYWQNAVAESIVAAEQALKLDPRSAIAHNNICAARAKQGEWERAIEECKIALGIDPGYQLAKNNLEWASSQQAGKPPAAAQTPSPQED